MVNLTSEKKISDKKYLAYSLILALSLILIGISLSSVRRKQTPSLFFFKVCIGKIQPKITDLPKESTAIQGKQYNITCKAESCFGDQTIFQWLDPQQRDLSNKFMGFSVKGGLLTLSNVTRSEAGEYTCRVVDEYGEDEAYVRLDVQVPPRIVQLGNLSREENSSATFECSAEGVPKPNLTLRKDGSYVPIRGGDGRVKLVEYDEGAFRVLQLTISDVKPSDGGLYSCQASNAVGLAVKAGHLEVQFKPDMSLTPAVVKAWSGNPGNLTCIAEANPNAYLVWKFRGTPIDRWDERYQIFGGQSQSSLLVRTDSYEVFGEYTCEAKNRLGRNSTIITLEEAFAPGSVTEIIFDRVTPTTITFLFIQPVNTGGLPITNYVIRYRLLTDPQERTTDWIKGSTYVLSDLKPRKMYKFSVAARNAAGQGPWLRTGYIMPAERVPDAPKLSPNKSMGVKSPLIHPDRVKLEWEMPNGNGQPVSQFEVRYFKMDRCQDPSEWSPVDKVIEKTVQIPAVELTGLKPDTCYSVQVRAINKIGKSPTVCVVLRTSKVDNQYIVRREDLDSTVCGMGFFVLVGFGFLFYRLVSPGTCARFLRPTQESKAFVISNNSEDKRKHGMFRV